MTGKPKTPATTEQRQQIVTLAAAGMSQTAIAKSIGRSRQLVRNTLAEPEVQKAVGDEKKELSEIFRQKSRDVVTSISDIDIAKASLQQKSISSGILLDKSLLLAGEATTIVDVRAMLEVASAIRGERDQAAEDRVAKWREAHSLPGAEIQPSKPL